MGYLYHPTSQLQGLLPLLLLFAAKSSRIMRPAAIATSCKPASSLCLAIDFLPKMHLRLLLLCFIYVPYATSQYYGSAGYRQTEIPLSDGDKQAVLQAHNSFRAYMGSAPLVWDERLENLSRKRVNTPRKDCSLVHELQGWEGENMHSQGSDSPYDTRTFLLRSMEDWADEVHKKPDSVVIHYIYPTGHARQMMQCFTKKIGCAIGYTKECGYVLYCKYDFVGMEGLSAFCHNYKLKSMNNKKKYTEAGSIGAYKSPTDDYRPPPTTHSTPDGIARPRTKRGTLKEQELPTATTKQSPHRTCHRRRHKVT